MTLRNQGTKGKKGTPNKKVSQNTSRICKATTRNNTKKEEPKAKKDRIFDTYTTDSEVHKLNVGRRSERSKSIMESVSFIRQSAWRREQLEFLQQCMDYEIKSEVEEQNQEEIDGTKKNETGNNEHRESANVCRGVHECPILHDIRELKKSVVESRESEYKDSFEYQNRRDGVLSEIRNLKESFMIRIEKNEDNLKDCGAAGYTDKRIPQLLSDKEIAVINTQKKDDGLKDEQKENNISDNKDMPDSEDDSNNIDTKNGNAEKGSFHSLSSTIDFSDENLWNGLSEKQRLRIQSRMKDFQVDSDSPDSLLTDVPINNISKSSKILAQNNIETNRKDDDNISNSRVKLKGEMGSLRDNTDTINIPNCPDTKMCQESNTTKYDADDEVFRCMSDVVVTIAESLFTTKEDKISSLVMGNSGPDTDLIPKPLRCVPELPLVHPYDLPLAEDVKLLIKSHCDKITAESS
jgi:hypothetical protein